MLRRNFSVYTALVLSLLIARQSGAETLTTLTSFNNANGDQPAAGLTISADGSTLYGTTYDGGANGLGTVFSIPVGGGAPTVLASFTGATAEHPNGGVTLAGSTLYGTTFYGGSGGGTVFSVPTSGGTPTVLASFNGTNGEGPEGTPTLSAGGTTLYGVTQTGGALADGSVYSVPIGGGTPTVLATFNGTDGQYPEAGLTLVGSTLYGTTGAGGANHDGTVFSVPIGGGTPTVLASFNGTDGQGPSADLTLVGSTLYGTTLYGGASNDGTVFSVPLGGGTPTVLASFNGTNGYAPYAGLAVDADGSTLYGTTSGTPLHDGTIFSVPLGGGTPTVLVAFNGTNGQNPQGDLTLSGATLYGTTYHGGANGDGTVFALALATPEPSSCVLLGLGALGVGALAARRRRRPRGA